MEAPRSLRSAAAAAVVAAVQSFFSGTAVAIITTVAGALQRLELGEAAELCRTLLPDASGCKAALGSPEILAGAAVAEGHQGGDQGSEAAFSSPSRSLCTRPGPTPLARAVSGEPLLIQRLRQ